MSLLEGSAGQRSVWSLAAQGGAAPSGNSEELWQDSGYWGLGVKRRKCSLKPCSVPPGGTAFRWSTAGQRDRVIFSQTASCAFWQSLHSRGWLEKASAFCRSVLMQRLGAKLLMTWSLLQVRYSLVVSVGFE